MARRLLCVLLLAGLTACSGPPREARPPDPSPVDGSSEAGAATAPAPGSPSPSAAPATPAASPPGVAGAARPGWWRPKAGLTWQWQLTGTIDTSIAVDVYDVDGMLVGADTVAALHRAGRRVICYINAGAWEKYRSDASRFPAAVLGRVLDGWPDERWLDIRRWDVLEPLLSARFAECKRKGFDGVEPDNMDAYANDSGFPLTAADQLVYNRRLADLAHRHGLAVGLKNDVEQAAELVSAFDFAVNEECSRYRECERLRVFVTAGKPVFHVEYDVSVNQFCPSVKALGFSSMRKRLDLDAWRDPC
jgi:hypothetical protein